MVLYVCFAWVLCVRVVCVCVSERDEARPGVGWCGVVWCGAGRKGRKGSREGVGGILPVLNKANERGKKKARGKQTTPEKNTNQIIQDIDLHLGTVTLALLRPTGRFRLPFPPFLSHQFLQM